MGKELWDFVNNLTDNEIESLKNIIKMHYFLSLNGTSLVVPSNVKLLANGDIPETITFLNLIKYKGKLKPGDIPNSVTTLVLGYCPKNGIEEKIIPKSVTELIFGQYFNQILEPGDIPDWVTTLYFGDSFNQELKLGVIPQSVIKLHFSSKIGYTQPKDKIWLSNNIKIVKFGTLVYKKGTSEFNDRFTIY